MALRMSLAATAGRVLLVLTTSGSDGHLRALHCHAAHWARNPLARHADVQLYSTRLLSSDFCLPLPARLRQQPRGHLRDHAAKAGA